MNFRFNKKGVFGLKKKICVIFGGESTEYEISLRSATSIIENLDKSKYDIITVGITRDGKWKEYTGDVKNIICDKWYCESLKNASVNLGDSDGSILIFDENGVKKEKVDCAFIALHGANGEDGTVQGMLRLAHIPFAGPELLTSCVGMDKAYTKIIFKNAGIDQAEWITINDYERENIDKKVCDAEQKLKYPMFVKPSNAGSSIGIGKAKNREELLAAIDNAFKFDRRIIIEEFLSGREVECAVMGSRGNIEVSCVGEIKAATEFYDYEAKYSDKSESQIIIPACFKEGFEERLRENAKKAFEALDGKGYSRVDFFVNEETGDVKINEINTLPGFTSISMFPKLFMHEGFSYYEILDKLIEIGME